MLKPKILISGKFYADDISVKVNPHSNRKIDKTVERGINPLWEKIYKKATAEGKQVWDGISFRLNDVHEEQGTLMFEVSPIKFSIRYPLCTMVSELEHLGEDYYAKGMGIGGIIETSDGKYIFGQRSGKTMTSNKIDVIGGFVEGVDFTDKREQGLLAVNTMEIKEELGIDSFRIKEMSVIGVVLSYTTNVVVVTYTELEMDSSEVRQSFNNATDDEMSDLVFVEKENLKKFLITLGGYKPLVVELL